MEHRVAQVAALIAAAVFGFLLGVLLMALLTAGREEESLVTRLEAVEAARRTHTNLDADAVQCPAGAGGSEEAKVSGSSERIDG